MHVFRRRARAPDADVDHVGRPEDQLLDPETGLYASWYLRVRLAEEVRRALRHGRPFSVIACIPQHLPGQENVQAVKSAGRQFSRLLRGGDLVGLTDDQCIVVGLPETLASGARVLAQRLRGELVLRTAHVSKQIWLVGRASCPEDGKSIEALLEAAIAGAKESRQAAA